MGVSYKYRLYPTKAQKHAFDEMLKDFCDLYNAALQQRIEAWRRRRLTLGFIKQTSELKATRTVHDGLARWSFSAEEQVLRRLDKAFQAFFSRIKKGGAPGFPRFRSASRYHAADFRMGNGLSLRKSERLGFVGIPGEVKVRWHRKLPSPPKSAILTRQDGKWYISFYVEVPELDRASPDSVGIDMGLTSLIALSNGETIQRPNWTKRAAKELRRRQRAIARCRRGSKERTKRKISAARFQAHVANKRRDYLHKISRDLVNRFGRIAIENLNVKGLARSMLAKDINDASWAQLTSMLDYKAASAGVEFIKVDPRGTSQTCPECGIIKPKRLSERMHRCDCGAVLDRDVAAARIVHLRAFGHGACPQPLSQRVTAQLG